MCLQLADSCCSSSTGSYLNGGLPLPRVGVPGTTYPPRTSPASLSSRSDEDGHAGSIQKRSRDSSKDQRSPLPQDYKCPLCQMTLGSQKEFTAHIRGHNEVKPSPDPNDPTGQAKVYYCCLCGKMLSSFSSLDRHMLVHSGERPFSCEKCGQTFTTNGNMHRHKRTHGARDSRESDGCSSGTSSNGGAQRGRAGRKRKTSLEQPATISSPGSVESAKMIQQISSKKNDVRNIFSIGSIASTVPSGHAKCPVCQETFFSEISLAAHVDSAHRGQELKCDECSNVFPGYSYLKLHKNIYHHKSLASFPLQALQQGLAGFPPMMTSTPQLKIEAELKEKVELKKEEKILDLSSPIKVSKSIFNISTEDLSNKDTPSEYDQDFDKEFDANEDLIRDMKLKGEFPCRICPAVYPNLRALKGHNKEHMDKPPYVCNVAACTYASNDKSTLARHMRTHTGEKPFECTLCNFGFTTKANCERHIKNKHGKLSREEVRDAIVVHEVSDDKLSCSGGERNLMNTSMTESNMSNSSFRDESPSAPSVSPSKKRRKSGNSENKKAPLTFFAPYHSSLFRPASEEKKVEQPHDEAPLDLSRSVPDFAKDDLKKSFKKDSPIEMPIPASYPNKMLTGMDFTKSLAAAVSAAQFQGLQHQMPFPFLFSHFAAASAAGTFDITAYLLAQQEALRRQREIEAAAAAAAMAPKDPTGLLLHLSNLQTLSARNFGAEAPVPNTTSTPTPLSAPSPPENRPYSYFSESNKERSDSENDYKMVIKNGVLMKKQKQRRYRTERPYECEKCNARFTLRSNMERHVKQQHAGGPNDMSNLGISNGKDADLYQREDEDRDDMEDSENEEMNKNGDHDEDDDDEEINVHDDDDDEEEEEEEEGIDLSNLEQLVKVAGSKKPFHTFFDTSEDEEQSDGDGEANSNEDRKLLSAYSSAPNKIPCPFCSRSFPWSSSLKRHILTHTGDKPYKCPDCPLWFTTKSNCDRHLARKHSNNNNEIRNVPERPYKCQMCPSSTFSSQSNLRKHQHSKHRLNNGDGFSSSSNEEEDQHINDKEGNHNHNDSKESSTSGMSETPYKCHLCEEGFSERDEAIGHLQKVHIESYQTLLAKGAFEIDQQQQPMQNFSCEEENYDQIRGKFPDYVNRKVICMFCTRKFWSAEDLRRHVRTHTGERPYSCDICQRTFTLKHSMLRHRKKHDSGVSSGGEVSESESEQGSAEARSTYTSSVGGGRSSPEEEAAKSAAAVPVGGIDHAVKKKRANLMDKINQLSSSVNHNDASTLMTS